MGTTIPSVYGLVSTLKLQNWSSLQKLQARQNIDAASVIGNTFSGLVNFSGTDTSGLRLKSLASVEYGLLIPGTGDLFVDSTTDRIDARLARGSVELIDSAGGQTINGTLTLTGLIDLRKAATANILQFSTTAFLRTDTSQLSIFDTSLGRNNISLWRGGNFVVGSSTLIAACSSLDSTGNVVDTSLSRNAAGVWQMGTTAANALGSLLLTNLTASGTVTAQDSIRVGTAGTNAPYIFPFTANTHTTPDATGRGLTLFSLVNAVGTTSIAIAGETALQASGTNTHLLVQRTFQPTSGTGTYSVATITTTINQTGGANGITRGLFINPTLTAAADFRGIEVGDCGSQTALRTGTGLVTFGGNVSASLFSVFTSSGVPQHYINQVAGGIGLHLSTAPFCYFGTVSPTRFQQIASDAELQFASSVTPSASAHGDIRFRRLGAGSLGIYAADGTTGSGLTIGNLTASGTVYTNSIRRGNNNSTLSLGVEAVQSAFHNVTILSTLKNTSGVAGQLTINSTIDQNPSDLAGSTDFLINRTEDNLGTGAHNFVDFQRNSVSRFSVSNFGTITSQGSIIFPGTAITRTITVGDTYNDGSSLQILNGATTIATFNAAVGISTGLNVAGTLFYVGGTSGPILRNNGGTIEVRNNANSDFANVSVAQLTTNTILRTNSVTRNNGSIPIDLYGGTIAGNYHGIRIPGAAGNGSLTNSSGIAGWLAIISTINQTGTAGSTDFLINRTETALGSGAHNFVDLQVGGVSYFSIANTARITSVGRITINEGSNIVASLNSSSISDTRVQISNTSTGGRIWLLVTGGQTPTSAPATGHFAIRDGTAGVDRLTIDATGNITCAANLTTSGKITGSASVTARASLNLPHGVAPTSPVDGDIWTATTGAFVRINGVTNQLQKAITSGTAAPSGGVDGDIYLQYV